MSVCHNDQGMGENLEKRLDLSLRGKQYGEIYAGEIEWNLFCVSTINENKLVQRFAIPCSSVA